MEHIEAEVLTNHCSDMQDFIGAVAEAAQTFSDDVAQAFGHFGFDQRYIDWNIAAVPVYDEPHLDQVAEDLLDEEGVALGLLVHGLGPRERHILAPQLAVELVHLGDGQTA